MLLTEFFEQHYVPRRLRGRSERSQVLYRLCLRRYAETIGRAPLLSDLTNENLLKHLARRNDVAAATRNKELAELTAMWRLAVQLDMHTGWPQIDAEPEPIRVPQAWLLPDMQRLLAACKASPGTIGDAQARDWWLGLVMLCLDTGERIGAIMQCQWDWLDGDSLVIQAEARKGSKRDKWYKLSSETLTVLRKVRGSARGDDMIFEWPYHRSYLWVLYRRLLERAGLPTGRKCGLHRLRKTAASVSYQAGIDPQELLDHSDRRTTQRYLDPRFTRENQASAALANWLRNPPKPAQPDEKTG